MKKRQSLVLLAMLALGSTAFAVPDVPLTFKPFDLWLDTGTNELVAYQIEITYDAQAIRIVGLEGGNTPAFVKAPYYDRKGLQGGRIIVAAFTTKDEGLPTGRMRIARIHVAVSGEAAQPKAELMTAAGKDGSRMKVKAWLEPTKKGE